MAYVRTKVTTVHIVLVDQFADARISSSGMRASNSVDVVTARIVWDVKWSGMPAAVVVLF